MSEWGVRFGAANVAFAGLWAPSVKQVRLVLSDGREFPMQACEDGWHRAEMEGLQPGDRYKFGVDGKLVPDPASRSQPVGATGWSELVDLDEYCWRAGGWAGRPWHETVLSELHVGTFSPAGTFLGAISHLDHLVRLGVTAIELMPVATFPGARNWGYDGVLPFAPDQTYGTPADLQCLVDECHARGLSILLDVVYNHFGPQSGFLRDYAPEFFTDRHTTPWGPAINFDGEQSAPVRAFYIENALHWLRDYRFDGLRLDAVQAIRDDSEPHILSELSARVRAEIAGRHVHLTLENDLNEVRWLQNTSGYEAQWNDDFHHVMRVLLAGQTDGYFKDYAADPIEHLGRALTQGFSYQGQESKHRPGMFRGTQSGHLPPVAFVNFVQNHDQVGNSPYGQRLSHLAPPEAVRLGAALLLLSPGIPMLFMGEEWAAGTPFDFFCDYTGEQAEAVRRGRREEFKQFDLFRSEAAVARLSDPVATETFLHSALDWHESGAPGHAEMLALYTALLEVRTREVTPLLPEMAGGCGKFTALTSSAIEARWVVKAVALVIAANFSSQGIDYSAPAGRTIFSLGAGEAGRLAGWEFRASIINV